MAFFSLFSGWAERKGAGRYYSALPDQLCASVFSTGEGDCACNIGVPFPRFIQIRENQRLQKNEKDSEEVTVAKILLQRLQLSLAESGFPATGMRGQGGDTPLLAEKGVCHNRGTLAKSGGERGIRTHFFSSKISLTYILTQYSGISTNYSNLTRGSC